MKAQNNEKNITEKLKPFFCGFYQIRHVSQTSVGEKQEREWETGEARNGISIIMSIERKTIMHCGGDQS